MSTSTCTHHNDQQRIACPVCLVTSLRAERDQLRALLVYTDQLHDEVLDGIISERDQLRAELAAERTRLDYVLKNDCPWNDRNEIDEDVKKMSGESKK